MQTRMRRNILWITRTAVFITLLVTVQGITAPLGNQFVTGAAGNLIMILSLLICGPATGLIVAGISPVCAMLVGFGPAFPPLVPFITLGNLVFIAAWFLLGLLNKSDNSELRYKVISYIIAIMAAVMKFSALYVGIVLFAVPYILNLNEKQSAVLSLTFSYPQLITASIGGAIALAIVPSLKKALRIS